MLGLDGVDPDVVDLLISEGKLPNFKKIREEGAAGRLLSRAPLLSPVVWTTVATGKTPDQHRIAHFVAVDQRTGEQLPVTSRMRHARAIWNIFSEAGRSVAVVGWWATWPAETVVGSVISDHLCYHFLLEGDRSGSGDTTGVTYPPDLVTTLAPLVRRPSDLTLADLAPFVHVQEADLKRPFDFNDSLSHFKWALAAAETYRKIGLRLWSQDRPELLMVYVEGTDSTSHLFGHLFRAQGLAGELAEQQERFGGAVEAMYVYADRLLGDFMAAADETTTLVVLSDHGFDLGQAQDDPSKTRDMRRVSERYHKPEGILFLWGRRVKPGAKPREATILDIAPTLLALAGIPPARDMPGRVLTEALDVEVLPAVDSYERGESRGQEGGGDAAVDPQIVEKLKSLGYIGATSPKGDRNLAAVLFESGRYEEALGMYRRLIEESPEDGPLRASLAGALGALGRHDEAIREIETAIRLSPLNPEAYHNRAVIHERQGKTDLAVADYRTALRYDSGYEPSKKALERLVGSAGDRETASEGQKQARRLAEEASQAARRGEYPQAMKMLDEAERLAPRYALVYQYRSNVAYLMGDRKASIAALKKGLELEPDNALFRENLKAFESSPTPR